MLKMKFWFEGNQLQPDCNIHGGCKNKTWRRGFKVEQQLFGNDN